MSSGSDDSSGSSSDGSSSSSDSDGGSVVRGHGRRGASVSYSGSEYSDTESYASSSDFSDSLRSSGSSSNRHGRASSSYWGSDSESDASFLLDEGAAECHAGSSPNLRSRSTPVMSGDDGAEAGAKSLGAGERKAKPRSRSSKHPDGRGKANSPENNQIPGGVLR